MRVSCRVLLLVVPVVLAGCGQEASESRIDSGDGSDGSASDGKTHDAGAGGATGAGGGISTAGTGGGSGGSGIGGAAGSGVGGAAAPGGAGGRAGANGGAAGTGMGSGGSAGARGAADAGTGLPAVRVVGRTATDAATGSLQYSWPGVNIQASFTGTQASAMMGSASGNNRVTVVIDGGAPRTLAVAAGQSTVSLASGLAAGPHDLVIWRNTEASPGGVTTFGGLTGFGSAGSLLAPPPAPARRIEVVGDSLSVGAGVEGNATCAGGIDAYTNNYLAYGSVAARALSADVVTVAYSGIGVYRNFGETTPTANSLTMPRRYPYAIPDTVLWDFSRYEPHVVVVNLGTNDFGPGDPGAVFESTYVSFVRSIRAKYPNTYFILIDMYGGMRLTRLDNVLAALKGSGESRIEVLSLNAVQNNLGCNQHPNIAGQQGMGTTLAARIRSVMGW